MARQRRSFSADFKARVALEALREQKTINEQPVRIRGASQPDRRVEEVPARRTAPGLKPPQSCRRENTGARAGADVSADRATPI